MDEVNDYIIKNIEYFSYEQFLNELEELKNNYYIVGYTIKSQENTAKVQLVRKGEEHDEVYTS